MMGNGFSLRVRLEVMFVVSEGGCESDGMTDVRFGI